MSDLDLDEELRPSGRERMNRARGLRSGTLRWAWATLTSMRTALLLLLLLGVAAIPGSLLPQRPTNPFGVAQYLLDNPATGPWLDRLGFFNVFGSAWFAAIYLLLFVSLIGCIIPRCRAYYEALRAEPGALPRRLSRFPDHAGGTTAAGAADVLDGAERHLLAAGYRVRREPAGLSAEKGYAREAGNLVFHLSLILVLVGLAWGSLFGYRGTAIVVEGQAFSNTLTQYDEFSAGIGFRPEHLPAFTVALDAFEVRFELGPVQRGAARMFRADVTVTRPGQTPRQQVLEVNAPLSVDGTDVHLLGHGYAPVVTIRDGNGDVAYAGPVVFLPTDGNFTSSGVIKAPDARPERLAFEGIFLPSAVIDDQGMRSVFPDAWNPQLLVNAWSGPPKQETGAPENIYVLDRTGLTQLLRPDGQPVRASLEPGATYDLPDGRGSITFDGLRRWTKLRSRPPLAAGSCWPACCWRSPGCRCR
ncbi:MAG: cytochrome c biogenesis protein ResB [Propionicimonas sp.]|nr:cytochrome c biogenesis protein ResB [Propionicimonas sp.]